MKIVIGLLLFSVLAFGDVVCASGTYADLEADGSCHIDISATESLDFSNFTFTQAGMGTNTAANVGITVLDPGSSILGNVYGFLIDPGEGVSGANQSEDILLTYTITAIGTSITSVDLDENATATGSGVGEVDETLGVVPMQVVSTGTSETDDLAIPGQTTLNISKDIQAFTGAAGGTAAISGVTDAVGVQATAVPEPSEMVVIGLGMLFLGLARFRFRRRRSFFVGNGLA